MWKQKPFVRETLAAVQSRKLKIIKFIFNIKNLEIFNDKMRIRKKKKLVEGKKKTATGKQNMKINVFLNIFFTR